MLVESKKRINKYFKCEYILKISGMWLIYNALLVLKASNNCFGKVRKHTMTTYTERINFDALYSF